MLPLGASTPEIFILRSKMNITEQNFSKKNSCSEAVVLVTNLLQQVLSRTQRSDYSIYFNKRIMTTTLTLLP